MRIDEAMSWGMSQLAELGNPELEAQFLLSHALGQNLAYIYANHEGVMSGEQAKLYSEWVMKRRQKMPLWQIVGTEQFYGLPIFADKRTLVPRPETEFLVEKALEATKGSTIKRALDMGTGAGGIACALAANLPEAAVVATDVSAEALEVARINVDRNGLNNRVALLQSDLFASVEGKYDLILANLPYVPHEDLGGLAFEIHHYEPRVALDGGAGGTEIYREFFGQLRSHLAKPAWVFLEIGDGQGLMIKELTSSALPDATVVVERDYQGFDRYVTIKAS